MFADLQTTDENEWGIEWVGRARCTANSRGSGERSGSFANESRNAGKEHQIWKPGNQEKQSRNRPGFL